MLPVGLVLNKFNKFSEGIKSFIFKITESGAVFIAWFGIVIYVLALGIFSLLLLFGSTIIVSMLSGISSKSHESMPSSSQDGSEGLATALGVGITMVVVYVVIMYLLVIVKMWASVSLLNGTNKVSLFLSFYQSAYLIY